MRRLAAFSSVLLLTLLLAGATVAKSPHEVDQGLLSPPLNPNLGPWTCWVAGNGIICEGSTADSWAGEEIGETCDGQPIYATGSFYDRAKRWHTADGRATKTIGVEGARETWSLSPDGTSPTVKTHWQVARHYTYFTPGDRDDRQLTETGAWWIATAPGAGLIFRDAGKITYAVGAGNDFNNPETMRGQFDTWTDWDAAIERVCAALGA